MVSGGSDARHHHQDGGHALNLIQPSASYTQRPQSEGLFISFHRPGSISRVCRIVAVIPVLATTVQAPPMTNMPNTDSWIEISSQPSSSSLSSINDEIVTTGLRFEQEPGNRRRRKLRQRGPSHLSITSRPASAGATSSQEEYEESESESDRVMTSSNEALPCGGDIRHARSPALQSTASDDDEDDRTAINYPTNNDRIFTPQPNAFSHPPSSTRASGSYFPSTAARSAPRPSASARHSFPARQTHHSPYNIISPSHNAAADHDAALRASLSTLISFAGAARGLPKKQIAPPPSPTPASNRMAPSALRMVPESALGEDVSPPVAVQAATQALEDHFQPTLRRTSTSTNDSVDARTRAALTGEGKSRAMNTGSGRSSSKDRRVSKKRRNSSAHGYNDGGDFYVTPTLLTWVVVAGVGVAISALSFSAGYSMGKQAGRFEVSMNDMGEAGGCAQEVGRSGLGLKRLRFSSVARTVGAV